MPKGKKATARPPKKPRKKKAPVKTAEIPVAVAPSKLQIGCSTSSPMLIEDSSDEDSSRPSSQRSVIESDTKQTVYCVGDLVATPWGDGIVVYDSPSNLAGPKGMKRYRVNLGYGWVRIDGALVGRIPYQRILTYPPNAARSAVSVTRADLVRCKPGVFCNDNLLEFYLRYLKEEQMLKEQLVHFHLFSPLFYSKLASMMGKTASGTNLRDDTWRPIERWLKGVDIFEKDFLLIPINDHLHWSLAIVCNLPMLVNVQMGMKAKLDHKPSAAEDKVKVKAEEALCDGGPGLVDAERPTTALLDGDPEFESLRPFLEPYLSDSNSNLSIPTTSKWQTRDVSVPSQPSSQAAQKPIGKARQGRKASKAAGPSAQSGSCRPAPIAAPKDSLLGLGGPKKVPKGPLPSHLYDARRNPPFAPVPVLQRNALPLNHQQQRTNKRKRKNPTKALSITSRMPPTLQQPPPSLHPDSRLKSSLYSGFKTLTQPLIASKVATQPFSLKNGLGSQYPSSKRVANPPSTVPTLYDPAALAPTFGNQSVPNGGLTSDGLRIVTASSQNQSWATPMASGTTLFSTAISANINSNQQGHRLNSSQVDVKPEFDLNIQSGVDLASTTTTKPWLLSRQFDCSLHNGNGPASLNMKNIKTFNIPQTQAPPAPLGTEDFVALDANSRSSGTSSDSTTGVMNKNGVSGKSSVNKDYALQDIVSSVIGQAKEQIRPIGNIIEDPSLFQAMDWQNQRHNSLPEQIMRHTPSRQKPGLEQFSQTEKSPSSSLTWPGDIYSAEGSDWILPSNNSFPSSSKALTATSLDALDQSFFQHLDILEEPLPKDFLKIEQSLSIPSPTLKQEVHGMANSNGGAVHEYATFTSSAEIRASETGGFDPSRNAENYTELIGGGAMEKKADTDLRSPITFTVTQAADFGLVLKERPEVKGLEVMLLTDKAPDDVKSNFHPGDLIIAVNKIVGVGFPNIDIMEIGMKRQKKLGEKVTITLIPGILADGKQLTVQQREEILRHGFKLYAEYESPQGPRTWASVWEECEKVRAKSRRPTCESKLGATHSTRSAKDEPPAPSIYDVLDESQPHPCIMLFDSAKCHESRDVFKVLRRFCASVWEQTWQSRKGTITFDGKTLPAFSPQSLPRQNNDCDCGFFVMQYAEAFVKNPLNVNKQFVMSKGGGSRGNATQLGKNWFKLSAIEKKRPEVLKLIQDFRYSQHDVR